MCAAPANEPTFRESVDLMFNRAAALMDLPPGLEEKIRVCQSSLDHLLASRDLLETNGIAVEIISAGGTGCYPITTAYPGITEIQAGGGIFMDLMYREACFVDDLDFALSLLGTVTSRHPTHAVIDAGFKSISGFHHQPRPLKRDDLEESQLKPWPLENQL